MGDRPSRTHRSPLIFRMGQMDGPRTPRPTPVRPIAAITSRTSICSRRPTTSETSIPKHRILQPRRRRRRPNQHRENRQPAVATKRLRTPPPSPPRHVARRNHPKKRALRSPLRVRGCSSRSKPRLVSAVCSTMRRPRLTPIRQARIRVDATRLSATWRSCPARSRLDKRASTRSNRRVQSLRVSLSSSSELTPT